MLAMFDGKTDEFHFDVKIFNASSSSSSSSSSDAEALVYQVRRK